MLIGFYCAVYSQYNYSSMVAFGVALAFMVYLLVNLPFTDTYQNYRSFVCHITMLMILFTADYYRTMKSNTPI